MWEQPEPGRKWKEIQAGVRKHPSIPLPILSTKDSCAREGSWHICVSTVLQTLGPNPAENPKIIQGLRTSIF